MVYISYPTEYGTLYSKEELAALSAVCRSRGVPLYIDSPTNQLFPIFDDAALSALGKKIGYTHWEKLERIGTFLSRMDKSVDYEQVAAEAKPGSIEFYEALDKIRQPYGAKIAIKQGGLIGKGPGRSTQKYVVPVMYEDYIFSFLIEEYGLIIGGIFVIFLYISLLARGSIIARNCEGHFAKVSVAGLCVLITGQAMMHILVNCDVGLLTGQTLPLISYGRTSFWCFSLAFGIILSISRMAARRIEKQTREADPLIELGAQSTGDELRDSLGDLDDYESIDRDIE